MPTPAAAGVARAVLRRAGVAVLTAAAVLAAAQLTILLPAFGTSVFPVWFPAGVMLYAIGRFGWPAAVGCAAGTVLFNSQLSPWWVAVGIGAGATLSYSLGAVALARAGFRGNVDDLSQARRFALTGVLFAPLVSAVNGPLWLLADGQMAAGDFPRAVALWWGGDAVGVIAVAPALYLVADRFRAVARTVVAVDLASLACVGLLAAAVFLPGSPVADAHLPVAFLTVLALSTISFLRPSAVAVTALLLVAALGLLGTARGAGPFSEYGPRTGAVLIGLFTGTVGVVTLMVVGARGTQARTAATLVATARDYQLLVDGSPTLICRYRADGRVTFANDTLRGFLGSAADTVARLGLTEARQVADADAEVACADAGGHLRWLQWTSRAVGTAADGVAEFQAVGVDVTARRLAEDERRAIERQMFQTAKLESLGVIAGGVAHDFNNILTGVLGNAELAARDLPPDAPAAVYLGRVADAAARAADLNRQLLAYAGKGKFVVREIDANALLAQTVELVRLSLAKKIDVRLERWPRLPAVHGDESQLQQVLMNLILNAGDAIGDRPGTITLRTDVAVVGGSVLTDSSTGRPAKPGRYVTVAVSDTGCGMDAATRARIFEPFFTTKFTGRGLGLAAVQGIIRGHHGALAVDTAVGRGTTFTVFLPEYVPPPPDAPVPAGSPSGEIAADRITPRPNARRNTVLVVDDEDAVRELTAVILGQVGWNVLTAVNGREGVDVFRTHADAIACAVLDLTMPEMDGLEAMAALRAERPRLPVLLCTGYSEDAVPAALTNAPTGLLLKPFRPADLRQALADLFAATAGGPTPLP